MNSKEQVLILGVDERSTLTVIRSLGRKGIKVHLGYDDNSSICRYSKYTSNAFELPDAGAQPDQWIKKLEELLKNNDYDLVIPVSDNYLVLMVHNRIKLEKYAKLAIPDNNGFEYTYNKNKTFELAEELNVPMPKTFFLENFDDIKRVSHEFDFPVIIKPISSKIWKNKKRHYLKVEVAGDPEAFKSIASRMLNNSSLLVQSYHKGVGAGIELLMNNGVPVASFQHERVHEPMAGGGSSYRKSVKLNSELYRHSVRMLKQLNWTGVAMVEYKYNKKTDQFILVEINGRFWGSLPLAVNAGVDFPFLLYNMLVHDDWSTHSGYKKEVFCRNITRDIGWFIESFRIYRKNPVVLANFIFSSLKEFKSIFLFNEYFDTLAMDDLRPGIIHISRFFIQKIESLKFKTRRFMFRLNNEKNQLKIKSEKKRLLKQLRNNSHIVFICKGNICRSPFAELYFKKTGKTPKEYKINSVGLIERTGRKSPENAVCAAKSYGVELSERTSQLLTSEIVKDTAVLFVMDIELYNKVIDKYPHARNKVFFLGTFDSSRPVQVEIKDPYGGGLADFKAVFDQIARSVEGLNKLLDCNR